MTGRGDFWSRRRAAVQAEQQAEANAIVQQQQAQELAEQELVQAEKTDEELLVELGLPDPDTMERGADFAAFMSKAVPERLRRRALRRLWVSDPVLACLDDLVDYADDYTAAATCVENLKTSYQVGRGMLAHIEAVEAQAKAKAEALAQAQSEGHDAALPQAEQADAGRSSSLRLPEAGSRTAAHGSVENAQARGLDIAPLTEADADSETQSFDETPDADRLIPAGADPAQDGMDGENQIEATGATGTDGRRDARASAQDPAPAQPRRHMRFAFAGHDQMTGADAPEGK